MSVINTIREWFQGAAAAKQDRLQEPQKKEQPPEGKPVDKGGIGATQTKIEQAKQEKDWPGDT